MRLPLARAAAYGLDAVGYAGIAAAMVPFGLASNAVWGPPPRPVILALSVIPPAVATVWAARAESGGRHATWGKRRLGILVEGTAQPLDAGRALLRNAVKILLPWQLGHVVTLGAVYGDFDTMRPGTIIATALLYPLMAVFAVMLLRRGGRGPHDLLAGTRVRWSAV